MAILVVNFTTKDLYPEFQDLGVVIPIVLASSSEGARGWVDLAFLKTSYLLYLIFSIFVLIYLYFRSQRDYFSFKLPKIVPLCR